MLNLPDNFDNQELGDLSASDVSSVQLDSDDSDFCTTIEIIKLKPVKKATKQAAVKETKVPHIENPAPVSS